MFEGILGIKKPILGLDIGHQTLKVVELKGRGAGAKLLGVAEVAILPGMLNKDGIREKEKLAGFISQALKEARPHKISAKIVSSALPESLVFTKLVDLPQMTATEISKNIGHYASEFFPISIKETYLDWQIIAQNPQDKKTEVLVVAAPKILVDNLTEVIKLSGLELMGMETKPLAVARALVSPNDKNSYLLVDIGAKTSGLTCYHGETIKFTSTINVGGDAIKKNFDASIDALSSELVNFIKYYENKIGGVKVLNKIILAGGGSNIKNVPETLKQKIKIEVVIGRPWINLKAYDPRFATAIGLAMKEI